MATEKELYRQILLALRSKKGLNEEQLNLLNKDIGLDIFMSVIKSDKGHTSLWGAYVLKGTVATNDAGVNNYYDGSYQKFIDAFSEDDFINNRVTDTIAKDVWAKFLLMKQDLLKLQGFASTITKKRWLQAVTNAFPDKGFYKYTFEQVEWDFIGGPNPTGKTIEQLKDNVVQKAKANNPEEVDREYTKFLNEYVSYDIGTMTIKATVGSITASGKDMEAVADKFYTAIASKYNTADENLLIFYDLYYYAGGGDVALFKNVTADSIPEAIAVGLGLNQETEQLQAQVAGNAPKPAEDEGIDYNFQEQYQYIDQCVLLTYIESISNQKKTAEKSKTAPYNNTTIKIISDTPELTINRFLLPKRLYTFFGKTGAEVSQGSSKVYRVGQPNTTGSAYREIQFVNVVNDHTKTLSLKGTNPSTARADIKFDLTFKMNNFQDIKSNELLFSLLERPGFVANGTGFNRWYKNQYHPSYYKKSLIYDITKKDTATIDNKNTPNDPSDDIITATGAKTLFYGFDTTLVDHNITFDESKSGEVSVNLDSMAYSEALMNLPYLDVLAGRGGHEERKKRESIIEAAVASGCTEETLDELRRSISLTNKGLVRGAKQRIVQRIIDLGLMSTLEIDYVKVKQIYENGLPDNVSNLQTAAAGGPTISIWGGGGDQEAPEEGDFENNRKISFFTLSDLIAVCSEIFFDKDFDPMKMHTASSIDYNTTDFPGFEPQFLTFDFNYKSLGQNKVIRINCGDIPIAVSWFSKFMNDQYYSKDMDYVPIGVFLRDITEKAFTQLISEVCFSNELESKVHFRVSFFKGRHGKNPNNGSVIKYPLKVKCNPKKYNGFLGDKKHIHDEVPFFCYGQDIGDKLGNGNDVTKTDDDKFTETDLVDYIVIHPYTQTYTSTNIDQEVADYLIDTTDTTNPYNKKNYNGCIPVIRSRSNVGGNFQTYTNVKEMNFKKVEGKYLREQRMFYFNDNAFLAIGNVYDVDITLNVVMPWFTPGMYIIVEPYTGDNMHWNNPDSIGYQLGMAGLYVIISVEHKTTAKDLNGETVLHCKWVNSAIDKGNLRVKEYIDKRGIKEVPAGSVNICAQFDELDDQIILSGKDIDTLLTSYASIKTKIEDLDNQSGNLTGNQVNNTIPSGYTGVDANHFSLFYSMTPFQVDEMVGIINDPNTPINSLIGNYTFLGLNSTAISTNKPDVVIEVGKVKRFKVASYITDPETGNVTESNANNYLIYNNVIFKED